MSFLLIIWTTKAMHLSEIRVDFTQPQGHGLGCRLHMFKALLIWEEGGTQRKIIGRAYAWKITKMAISTLVSSYSHTNTFQNLLCAQCKVEGFGKHHPTLCTDAKCQEYYGWPLSDTMQNLDYDLTSVSKTINIWLGHFAHLSLPVNLLFSTTMYLIWPILFSLYTYGDAR